MRVTGIWTYDGDPNLFHQNPLFCPVCKDELSKCVEGCTVYHLQCNNCGFRIIFIDQPKIWDLLFEETYNRIL